MALAPCSLTLSPAAKDTVAAPVSAARVHASVLASTNLFPILISFLSQHWVYPLQALNIFLKHYFDKI
jgi:hypothetical protein